MQIRWCILESFRKNEHQSRYCKYTCSSMCRFENTIDMQTFIKNIEYTNGNSNLKCPKWSSNCVCDAVQCTEMQCSDKRFKHSVRFLLYVQCSVFTQMSTLSTAILEQDFPLSVNRFCVHKHFHSLQLFDRLLQRAPTYFTVLLFFFVCELC